MSASGIIFAVPSSVTIDSSTSDMVLVEREAMDAMLVDAAERDTPLADGVEAQGGWWDGQKWTGTGPGCQGGAQPFAFCSVGFRLPFACA
jgi:hypothetical protein